MCLTNGTAVISLSKCVIFYPAPPDHCQSCTVNADGAAECDADRCDSRYGLKVGKKCQDQSHQLLFYSGRATFDMSTTFLQHALQLLEMCAFAQSIHFVKVVSISSHCVMIIVNKALFTVES